MILSSLVAAWMGGEGYVFGISMFLPALNVCVGSIEFLDIGVGAAYHNSSGLVAG